MNYEDFKRHDSVIQFLEKLAAIQEENVSQQQQQQEQLPWEGQVPKPLQMGEPNYKAPLRQARHTATRKFQL